MLILLSVITFISKIIGTTFGKENARVLQSPKATITPGVPYSPYTTTSTPLRYYGDDITIQWSASLGCGACITGGYTFCVLGKEGQDFAGKTVTQTCCKDATTASCPMVSNSQWTCSNIYSDRMLAKNICPYKSTSCGNKTLF